MDILSDLHADGAKSSMSDQEIENLVSKVRKERNKMNSEENPIMTQSEQAKRVCKHLDEEIEKIKKMPWEERKKYAIEQKTISAFKKVVLSEMDKYGASDADKGLVDDEVIAAQIRNGGNPKDTAWAIMQ